MSEYGVFLVAVPDDVGGLCSPRLVTRLDGGEEEAWRLMDQLNRDQKRFDGTEPWRVFPVNAPLSNDLHARRQRGYQKTYRQKRAV